MNYNMKVIENRAYPQKRQFNRKHAYFVVKPTHFGTTGGEFSLQSHVANWWAPVPI
jgi:hypothetical protein